MYLLMNIIANKMSFKIKIGKVNGCLPRNAIGKLINNSQASFI